VDLKVQPFLFSHHMMKPFVLIALPQAGQPRGLLRVCVL
jgi:hypothetical protein